MEGWPCISVYLPTERAGDNKKSLIRFKNKVSELRDMLAREGLKQEQVSALTEPLSMLLDDTEIWRHMSDGLAVFASPGKFAYSTFPIRFRDYAGLGNRFYLLPLIPLFNGDGRFFVLGLSLNKVRLLEGTRDHIQEIAIEDLVPQNMEESLGSDYEQKSLQFRSGQSGQGHGLYHGQGRGKDTRKEEITRHFRKVSTELSGIIQGDETPMVVACVDYLFPIFRSVNKYKSLYGKHLSGNPDELHIHELHRGAWDLLKGLFQEHRRNALRQYDFLSSKGRTTSVHEELDESAQEGRIDTLFIQRTEHLCAVPLSGNSGSYNNAHQSEQEAPHFLMDALARATFLQGGRVYLLEEKEMPEQGVPVAASLRF